MDHSATPHGKFQFAIDRGGTFTDVWAKCPNGNTRVMKLLSVDPSNYPDAPKEAIRRIIQQVCLPFISPIMISLYLHSF